jgi:hypothetical protein
MRRRRSSELWTTLAALALLASCDGRLLREQDPVYVDDVSEILDTRCSECHSGPEAEAGWRVSSYLEVLGCVESSGVPAVLPSDDTAPLLSALDDEDHQGRFEPWERARLGAWVRAGTPARQFSVHDPGIIDPRSEAFHGKVLRDERWARMLEPDHPDTCGRCHDGAPVRPEGVVSSATRATACTECHSGDEGVLSCDTCHGGGGRAYPIANPCFDGASESDAHAAHAEAGDVRAEGLSCEACHPERDTNLASGEHGDGTVDVVLDPSVVGEEAHYDAEAKTCSVACHDRGGERPRPTWTEEGPMECDDCHGSPPEDHNPDACDRCHADVNADGDELSSIRLHLNGQVDLRGVEDDCGACHGEGDDPWPDTDAHATHRSPDQGLALECAICHRVPEAVDDEGHLDDSSRAEVVLSGIAGEDASYDAEARTCSVQCHDRAGAQPRPAWDDEGPLGCDDCHLSPPAEHNPTACDRCHAEAAPEGDRLTSFELHVNGAIDLGDGSERCGTCHGEGDDPWPESGSHAAHANPELASSVACETCHIVPGEVRDEGHLDLTAEAEVSLSGLASARGAAPVFDGSACLSVACHGYGLIDPVELVPRWGDPSGEASRCGACHGLPPAWPHPDSTACESLMCHGGEVVRTSEGLQISERGRVLHMNGVIDVGRRGP